MITQNNTKLEKSQVIKFLSLSIISLILFAFTFTLDLPLFSHLLLITYISCFPIFLLKPNYFIYFILLVMPSFRFTSYLELINIHKISINFNYILNLSIIFFSSIIIFQKRKKISLFFKNYPFILFLVFTTFSFFSIIYSINKPTSIEEFSRIFTIFMLILSSFLIIDNKKSFQILSSFIIGGTIIPIIFSFYQLINGIGWWDDSAQEFRITGTFMHPALLAFYLLFNIPITLNLLKDNTIKSSIKLFLKFLIVIFCLLIFLSLTRNAWLGLLAIIFIYGFFKNKKIMAISFLILLVSIFFIKPLKERVIDITNPKENSSIITRLNIIKRTIPAIKEAPLLGTGFGTFADVHAKYNQEVQYYDTPQAHNDYLRILIELGFIGLIIYLSIFISIFIWIYQNYKNTNNEFQKTILFNLFIITSIYLIISANDNILRTMDIQLLFWSYISSIFACFNLEK